MIALAVASLLTVGLIVHLGIISLLIGAFYFLFGKKKFEILNSALGPTGFAFAFSWNAAREPAKITTIRIRLFNPFGSPTQVDVTKEFDVQSDDFALDLDLGPAYAELLSAEGFDKAKIEITLFSKDCLSHHKEMKAFQFKSKLEDAKMTAEKWMLENGPQKEKVYYTTVTKSFIADPLPLTKEKKLRIASNPEFAGEFASGAAPAGAAVENFSVSKVWIEPGCIVCDACEDIFPEVFEVTSDTCIIRPGAPMDDGLRITEAAEACPVEVIKFNKA
ncbi:MAG: ferredoxin [Bacteriovoracaceae bacterium]|nr:ferredoxin [Bacteriovoracaceae bacterium]